MNSAMRTYFPDYGEDRDEFVPEREYFWNVFHSLEPAEASQLVMSFQQQIEARKLVKQPTMMITMRMDIYCEIQSSPYRSQGQLHF